MTHDDILILRYCLSVFMYLFVIDFLFNHCAPVYLYQSVYATEYVHTRIIYIHNDTRTHTHVAYIFVHLLPLEYTVCCWNVFEAA